ncbi:uncharacterized protein VTP21DRAFT_8923 [Calcarisporiella thermophila]|uniref:uncharacterized protein n=1 Tax=Calcarisporiella thermophila TaxID=911321 RepID=UPI003742E25E
MRLAIFSLFAGLTFAFPLEKRDSPDVISSTASLCKPILVPVSGHGTYHVKGAASFGDSCVSVNGLTFSHTPLEKRGKGSFKKRKIPLCLNEFPVVTRDGEFTFELSGEYLGGECLVPR